MLTAAVAGENPDYRRRRAAFPTATKLRLEAGGSVESRQELELGPFSHLIGLVHQNHVESPARRTVLARIVQTIERGHVAFLAADVVKGSWKLVGEGQAQRRLATACRADQQHRHRPGSLQKISEQPLFGPSRPMKFPILCGWYFSTRGRG